jgi:hypothetical protein
MAKRPGPVFEVMASAYRHDVLDKYMSLSGDAIEGAVECTGLSIGDLVNKMDEADERTVMRIDALLARSGPVLRLAANDRLMAAVSRILDVGAVRRAMVAVMRRSIVKAVSGDAGSPAAGEATRACTALEGKGAGR